MALFFLSFWTSIDKVPICSSIVGFSCQAERIIILRSLKHLVAEGCVCGGQTWTDEDQLTRSMTASKGEDVRIGDEVGRREDAEDIEEGLENEKQEKAKAKSTFKPAGKQLSSCWNLLREWIYRADFSLKMYKPNERRH